MTADERAGALPAELSEWPTCTPDQRGLDDLELLLGGAYAPLTGFMTQDEAAAVRRDGRLPDGTPWPMPVTLAVPANTRAGGPLVLVDPESSPVGLVEVTETWQQDGATHAAGPVRPLRRPEHGTFRRLRRSPADVREELGTGPVLATVIDTPPLSGELAELCAAAERIGGAALVLVAGSHDPNGHGHGHRHGYPHLSTETVIRTVLAARPELPARSVIVSVPLPAVDDPVRTVQLHASVAAAYGATQLLTATREDARPDAPLQLVPTKPSTSAHDQLAALLESGDDVPVSLAPAAVVAELRKAWPPPEARGLVVFFTGLSGSGKSTIARALHDALLESGDRTVSLLDGDVVRRMLSAGLTFSREDRDLNIRRIGYVAAEVARHGGVAICAPIAPYAATRSEARHMAEQVGDFVLVHVSTPLEVCEQRDRKGLYAKARAGVIPTFTGISDPYEEPADAEVVVDTSDCTEREALQTVLDALGDGGWIPSAVRSDGR